MWGNNVAFISIDRHFWHAGQLKKEKEKEKKKLNEIERQPENVYSEFYCSLARKLKLKRIRNKELAKPF